MSTPSRMRSSERERLCRDDLDRRVDDRDPVALDAPHDRDAPPADLRVDERVADVDRDLVPELGVAVGVADDQDVRHGVEPTHPRVGCISRGVGPPGAASAPRRGLGPASRCGGARLGPARDDAAPRHRGARRAAVHPRPDRPRSVHRRRGRAAARRGRAARRVAPVRLRRPEPRARDAARLGEGAARAVRAARRDDAAGRARAPRMGRGAPHERLRVVPPLPSDERRAEAALRRVLRVVGQPVHAAPRRLRARDADERGAGGVRGAAPGADGAGCRRARGRRVVPPRRLPARGAARVRGERPPDDGLRRRGVAARPDRAPVLHVVLEPGRPPHDPLPARRPRVRLVDAARGGPRPLRPRDRRLVAPLAARRRAVARAQRVAEPDVGEPRRAQPAVLGALVRAAAGAFPRAAPASSSTRSSARSTAPSRG